MSDWIKLSDDVKVITSEEDLFVVKKNNTLIEISNNATNGDIIKALFPHLKYTELRSDDWWNAPYKKGEHNEQT